LLVKAARGTSRGRDPFAVEGRTLGNHRLSYFFTDQSSLGIVYEGSVGPCGYLEVVSAETCRGGCSPRPDWDRSSLAGMQVNV